MNKHRQGKYAEKVLSPEEKTKASALDEKIMALVRERNGICGTLKNGHASKPLEKVNAALTAAIWELLKIEPRHPMILNVIQSIEERKK